MAEMMRAAGAVVLCLAATACTSDAPARPEPSRAERLTLAAHQLLARGDLDGAGRLYDTARGAAEALDDVPGLVTAWNGLGAVERGRGRTEEARMWHERALRLAEPGGRADLLIPTLTHLGTAEQLQGRTKPAAAYFDRALALAKSAGDHHAEAVLHNNLGLLAQQDGRRAEAQQEFEAARGLHRARGEQAGEAIAETNLGLLAEDGRAFAEAQAHFASALELDKSAQAPRAIAADLANLARICERLGQPNAGRQYAERAYWSFRAIGDPERAAAALNRAIALSRQQGLDSEARRLDRELQDLGK